MLKLHKWDEGTRSTTSLKALTSTLKARLRAFAISFGFKFLFSCFSIVFPFSFSGSKIPLSLIFFSGLQIEGKRTKPKAQTSPLNSYLFEARILLSKQSQKVPQLSDYLVMFSFLNNQMLYSFELQVILSLFHQLVLLCSHILMRFSYLM